MELTVYAIIVLVAAVVAVVLASREATRWPVSRKVGLGVVFAVVAWGVIFAINTGVSAGTATFIGEGLIVPVLLWSLLLDLWALMILWFILAWIYDVAGGEGETKQSA